MDCLPISTNQSKDADRAFGRAKAKIKEQLTAQEFKRFEEVVSLDHLVLQTQEICQRLQKESRATTLVVLGVEPAARILEGVCKLAPMGGDLIWGTVSFILEMVKDNNNILEEVLGFFMGMAEEIGYLQVVESTFHRSRMVVSVIEAVYVAILRFWVRAMEYYINKMKKNIVSRVKIWFSASRTMSNEFKKLKEDIAAQKMRLHEVEATQHYAEEKLNQAELQTILQMSRQKELSKWIDAPHYEHDLNTANEHRHDGTCEWLRRKPEFLDWVEHNSSPILVVQGTAGAGKTILSSWLVKEAQAHPARRLTLYHFFKETDDNKNTPLAAARSLLDQLYYHLLLTNHTLIATLESSLQDISRRNHVDFGPLWNIISSVLLQYSQLLSSNIVTIVLDAMDECSNPGSLVQSLRKLVHTTSHNIHVVVTGRPWGQHLFELRRPHPDQPLPLFLEVTQDDVKDDIAAFVVHSISQVERLDNPKHQNLRDRIIAVFSDVENHQGMFLWAYLMCKEVECQLQVSGIWKLLEQLPRGLNGMYARICKRLSANDRTSREFGRQVLEWIVTSRRPLTFGELEEALRVTTTKDNSNSPDADFFDQDGGLLWSRRDIVRCCGDLVRYTGLDEGDTIGIVHLSARYFLYAHPSSLYLQVPNDMSTFVEPFLVDFASTQVKMALVCITYILSTSTHYEEYFSPPIRFGLVRTPGRDAFKKRYPLFDYAAIYWTEYALNIIPQPQNDKQEEFPLAVMEFIRSPVSVIWLEEVIRLTYVESVQDTIRSSLERTLTSPDMSRWLSLLMQTLVDFSLALSSHPQMVRLCLSHQQMMSHNKFEAVDNGITPLEPDRFREYIHYDPVTDYLFSATNFPWPTLKCQKMKSGARLRPLMVPISTERLPEVLSFFVHSAAFSPASDFIAVTFKNSLPTCSEYLTTCWDISHLNAASNVSDWATVAFGNLTTHDQITFSSNAVAFGKDKTIITPGGVFSLITKECVGRPSTIYDPDPSLGAADIRFSGNGERIVRTITNSLEVLDISGTSIRKHEFVGSSAVMLRGLSNTGKKVILGVEGKKPELFCFLVDETKQIKMAFPSHGIDTRHTAFTGDEERFVAVIREKGPRRLGVWALLPNEDGSSPNHADVIYIFESYFQFLDLYPYFLFDLVPGTSEGCPNDVLLVERSGRIIRQALDLEWFPHEYETSRTNWVVGTKKDLAIWSIKHNGLLSVEKWSLGSSQPELVSQIEERMLVAAGEIFKPSPDGVYLATNTAIIDARVESNSFGVCKHELLEKMKSGAFSLNGELFACLDDKSTLHVFGISRGPKVTHRASFTFGQKILSIPVFSNHDLNLLAVGQYVMRLEDRTVKIQTQISNAVDGFSACGLYYHDTELEFYLLDDSTPETLSTSKPKVTYPTSMKLNSCYIHSSHVFILWQLDGIVYLKHKLIHESNSAYRFRVIWVLPDAISNQSTLIWPEKELENLKLLIVSKGVPTLIDTAIKRGEVMKEEEWFDS